MNNPCVVEEEMSISMRELLDRHCGVRRRPHASQRQCPLLARTGASTGTVKEVMEP